jgi:glycopeptide antibiotics resistance protein
MQKRSFAALVLIGYSALLIYMVVFKGPIRMTGRARPGREERAEGGRPGRGRGDPQIAGGSESRTDARGGPGPSARTDTRLSTSRFALLHANYVPLKTILPQLRGQPRWSSAIINLVGNTVLFVPTGFLVLLVYRRMSWKKAFVFAVAVGVTMEVMQGVLRVGVVDVDDVILNALGVMSGYWICMVWERRRGEVVVRPT